MLKNRPPHDVSPAAPEKSLPKQELRSPRPSPADADTAAGELATQTQGKVTETQTVEDKVEDQERQVADGEDEARHVEDEEEDGSDSGGSHSHTEMASIIEYPGDTVTPDVSLSDCQ